MSLTIAGMQVAAVHAATTFLAQPEGADPGGRGEGFGKSTPVGLLLVILLLIAVGFLVRSMTKHLKRAQANLGPQEEAPADGDSERADDRRAETAPSDETST